MQPSTNDSTSTSPLLLADCNMPKKISACRYWLPNLSISCNLPQTIQPPLHHCCLPTATCQRKSLRVDTGCPTFQSHATFHKRFNLHFTIAACRLQHAKENLCVSILVAQPFNLMQPSTNDSTSTSPLLLADCNM